MTSRKDGEREFGDTVLLSELSRDGRVRSFQVKCREGWSRDRLYLVDQRRLRAMLHEKGLQGEWILIAHRPTLQQQSQLDH